MENEVDENVSPDPHPADDILLRDVNECDSTSTTNDMILQTKKKHCSRKMVMCITCGLISFLLLGIVIFILVFYWPCFVTNLVSTATIDSSVISRSSVHILSYNIFLRMPFVVDEGSAEQDDYKDERTDDFINNVMNSYDIIALQETWLLGSYRKKRIIDAAVSKGFNYYVGSACPGPGIWPSRMADGMLLILSRFPIIEYNRYDYSEGIGVDGIASKGIVYAKIRLFSSSGNHSILNLFTTHLQAGGSSEDWNVRKNQFSELAKYIQEYSNTNQLVMLTGDMNTDGHNPTRYEMMMNTLGSFRDLLLESYNGTHPVTTAGRLTGPLDETEALDYIFFMGPKNTTENQYGGWISESGTSIVPFWTTGKPYKCLSDHFGVETLLHLF